MEGGRIIKTGGKELALELEDARLRLGRATDADGERHERGMTMTTAVPSAISSAARRQRAQLPASAACVAQRAPRARARARERAERCRRRATRSGASPISRRSPRLQLQPLRAAPASPADVAAYRCCRKRRRGWCSSTASMRRSCRSQRTAGAASPSSTLADALKATRRADRAASRRSSRRSRTTSSPRSTPRICATARWSSSPRNAALRQAGASAVRRHPAGHRDAIRAAWWSPKPAARVHRDRGLRGAARTTPISPTR